MYEGEYKANKKEGYGTLRYATGQAMVSRYQAGVAAGVGAFWCPDRKMAWRVQGGEPGEEISLEEAAKIADEIGLPVPPEVGEYEGERNVAGQREGRGTMCWPGGDVYEGEWKANQKEGRGTIKWADGEQDIVEWRADARVGEGARWSADRGTTWLLQDGELQKEISTQEADRIAAEIGLPLPPETGEYEGEHNVAGQREGCGTMCWPGGNMYEGDWKAGKREGWGTMRYANGNVEEGEWKEGKQWGRGTYRRASDGEQGMCRFVAGRAVGEGAAWSADGQSAWRLTNFEDGEDITLEDAKRIADSIGLPVPEILPEFVVEARRRGRSLSAAGVEE